MHLKCRRFFLLTAIAVMPLIASCTSSTNDMAGVESVVGAPMKQQEMLIAKQREMIEAQKALIEAQRQKQMALLETRRLRFKSSSALVAKPSELANSATRKAAEKPKVRNASVGVTSRAPANITLNAPWKCVPNKLKAVINEVSRRYGPVTVNSTHRSHSKNRRIGGAKRSYHLRCQAVDFRVRGDSRKVMRFLRNHPHVGGLKRYRSGYFHIDTGPKRTWRG